MLYVSFPNVFFLFELGKISVGQFYVVYNFRCYRLYKGEFNSVIQLMNSAFSLQSHFCYVRDGCKSNLRKAAQLLLISIMKEMP